MGIKTAAKCQFPRDLIFISWLFFIPMGIKSLGNQTPWELVSWELIFAFQLFFIPMGTFPWESNPMGIGPLGINFCFSAVFYSHGNIPLGIKPHGNWSLGN